MVVQIKSSSESHARQHQKSSHKSPKQQLYRQQAIEQTASPDQLDIPIQIIHPKRWLSLLALGTLVAGGLAWSVFGRIPITVSGKGLLTYPSQIVSVQSPGTGRVAKVAVKVGDRVTKGQVLAILDQSELRQQLELAQSKLHQLQFQDQSATASQQERERLEQTTIAKQRLAIQQELQTVTALTPELNDRGLTSLDRERRSLQERLAYLQQQATEYAGIWQRLSDAADAGVYPRNSLIKDRQEYLVKPQTDILDVEAQLKKLDLKETNARQDYLKNTNKVNELQAQLRELESKAASQAEQDLTARTSRNKEIQDTKRAIAQLELQLQQSTQIVSEHDGYIREFNLNPGQRIETGAGIGVIAANKRNSHLTGITFLPVEDGKKLDEAMVKRGVNVQITPTTVKREEYGGIRGKVTQVSQASITQEGAVHLVGNPAILPTLMEEGKAYIIVFSKLEPAAEPGKYQWTSSQGPDQSITEGTTTTATITVEERAPISYVIPLLKSLVGQ